MSQPTAYSPNFDFQDFSMRSPAGQQPGQKLDAEFTALGATTKGILFNLAKLQRDDGALAAS